MDIERHVQRLYQSGAYVLQNPTLHEEDSPWKVSLIEPLLDQCVQYILGDRISLLDAGGGAGLMLRGVAEYLARSHSIMVEKYALDLSPAMLERQAANNPDLKRALDEDLRCTSLGSKEIDLTLVIDVLEHIPHQEQALSEIRRISRFAIVKVPLADNPCGNALNWLTHGRRRQRITEAVGHVNLYNPARLRSLLQAEMGEVLHMSFANVHAYFLHSAYYQSRRSRIQKLKSFVASRLFSVSPRLCHWVFTDYAVVLVRCYPT